MAVLSVRSVHKYYGGTPALAGVDLEVQRGEIVALLGPNGAGKTSIFELLLGLVRPTSGTVTVLDGPPGANRHRIGAMLQSGGLLEQLTVRELVRLIGLAYPQRLDVDEALERTALTSRARRMVTALSGGERQRLLLAMAIIGSPELLLLDEPTAAMDIASRRRFWTQARAAVGEGATILFATHDLHEAETVADRVVVVADGRVLVEARPSVLAATGGPQLEELFVTLTEESVTTFEGTMS